MTTNYWYPHEGGIERLSYEEARRLVERGHEVTILTSNHSNLELKAMIEGIDVIRVPALNILENYGVPYPIFYPSILSKTLKSIVPTFDIIHAHGHPYISSYLAGRVATKYKEKFVASIHNSFIDYKFKLFNIFEKLNDRFISSYTLKSADMIITPSPYIDNYIKKQFGNLETTIVFYGIDYKKFELNKTKEEIRKLLNLPKEKFICLTVGRITFKKGIDALLEVANLCENRDILFLIVGSGPDLEKLMSISKKMGLESKVKFIGYVSDEKLLYYYNSADVFILPSKSGEGLPTTILEAFSSSLPVIATKTGGQVDIIEDDFNGYLVEPNNASQLFEKLEKVINNSAKENREMGKHGQEIIKNKFTWGKHMESLISLYEKLKVT